MFLTALYYVIILIAALVALNTLFSSSLIPCIISIVVIGLCMTGIDRNVASQTCDAINAVGGRATFLSGKCIILNSGGMPAQTDNDRLVYVNQQ